MLETFTVQTFAPLVGDRFVARVRTADAEEIEVPLQLESATPSPAPPGDRGRPPFSLVFTGPLALRLVQSTFPLQHENLGAFELFLVPIGVDADVVRYEAVFT